MTRRSFFRAVRRLGFAGLIPVLLCLPAPARQDWPEWRGGALQGSSSATDLPTDLSPESASLRWRAVVPGEGHSSPIVSRGRVFVTTAYGGGSSARLAKHVGMPALALLALVACWLAWRRRRGDASAPVTAGRRRLLALDALLVGLATAGFLALSLAMTFRPGTFWPPGQPGEAWFFTGAIGMAGLAAAVGWMRPGSGLRVVGALALVACAIPLWLWIPPNKYKGPFSLEIRAVMVAPAAAFACWYGLVFLLARGKALRSGGPWSALGTLALASAAGLLFLVSNVLEPRAGLARALVCYDLEDGRELWNTALFEAPAERKYPVNTYATPTPCADGERVFAYFGVGFACTDYDGRILWQGRDPDFTEASRYGSSSSPVLFEDAVLVFQDNEVLARKSSLMSLERATGDVRWSIQPDDSHDGYSTPSIVPRGDAFELVAATQDLLLSYDPRSGERLWSMPLSVKQMVPSLCYAGNDLLLVAGGTHLEFSSTGVRLNGSGRQTKPEVLWESRRAVPAVSSPVLAGGCFFTVSDGGILSCIDPESGDVHWKERIGGTFWSSLVAGDGKVYALSEEGKLSVVAARPEYELIAESQLGESCYATPAIVDGRILVRTTGHLYCFGAPER